MASASTTSERIPRMWDGSRCDWEQEAGSAGQHRGHKKQQGPAIQGLAAQQSEHHDKSRANPHQAQQYMHKGECLKTHAQNHDLLLFTGNVPMKLTGDGSGMGRSESALVIHKNPSRPKRRMPVIL